LGNREKWAAFDPLEGDAADLIRSIRDRLIANAGLAPGRRVLDLGAGTGLIARQVRRHLGTGGMVVALDLSEGALRGCRERATHDAGAPLHVVVGEALRLPFAAATFDVATARSVLMYVADKLAAARELRRVLRPGGRVAVFEPINRHTTPARWYEALDASDLPPAHTRIVAELRARLHRQHPDRPRALAFDERDLVRAFVDAGFAEVRLTYEYTYTEAQRVQTKPVEWYLERSGYAEIAHSLVGDAADGLLACLAGRQVTLPQRGQSAEAYLVARR
jgi:ubiquinone/menaquinone biosynthesis C-methylase UbiE